MTRKRKIGWALLLLLALAAGALYRLAQDPNALFALLRDRLQQQLGLELRTDSPAQIGWWPQPALALRGVHISAAGSPDDLLTAASLRVAVPWRAAWSSGSTLGAASMTDVDVDAVVLKQWLEAQAAAELGPGEPLRWPTIDEAFSINKARWHAAGMHEPISIDFDIDPFALRSGEPFTLKARVRAASLPCKLSDCLLELSGIPDNDATGVVLNNAHLLFKFDATTPKQQHALDFRGDLAYAQANDWRASGELVADALPIALHGIETTTAQPTTKLNFRLVSRLEQRVDIDGMLAGAVVSAHFALAPLNHTSSARDWLELLASSLRGSAQIDNIEIDGIRIEGLRMDDEAADADPQGK